MLLSAWLHLLCISLIFDFFCLIQRSSDFSVTSFVSNKMCSLFLFICRFLTPSPLTHWRMLTHQICWLFSIGWCHFGWHHCSECVFVLCAWAHAPPPPLLTLSPFPSSLAALLLRKKVMPASDPPCQNIVQTECFGKRTGREPGQGDREWWTYRRGRRCLEPVWCGSVEVWWGLREGMGTEGRVSLIIQHCCHYNTTEPSH